MMRRPQDAALHANRVGAEENPLARVTGELIVRRRAGRRVFRRADSAKEHGAKAAADVELFVEEGVRRDDVDLEDAEDDLIGAFLEVRNADELRLIED